MKIVGMSLRSAAVIALVGVPAMSALAQEKPWYPFPVEVWDPPFNMDSPRKKVDYTPSRRQRRNGTSASPSPT